MAKRIKITEQQLNVVVNYLNEKDEKELIEEGWKETLLIGLMTLATASGIKGQSDSTFTPDEIKAAELVQDKLPDEITKDNQGELANFFSAADIETSNANLEKLKNVKSNRIHTKTLKKANTASQYVNKGWAIESIEVSRDTTWEDLPGPAVIDTSLGAHLDGNLYNSGDYELNDEGKRTIDDILDGISMMGGDIVSVYIKSSTDKEELKTQTKEKLTANGYEPTNDGLALARKDGIHKHLESIGVDTSLITFNLTPNSGPDVYKGKSDEERAKLHPKTAKFRDTELIIRTQITPKDEVKKDPVYTAIETVLITLQKKGAKIGVTDASGGGKPTKIIGCKVIPKGSIKDIVGKECKLFKK